MNNALCPECGFQFQGPGWTGIDSHWKKHHSNKIAYETAWHLIRSGKYKCESVAPSYKTTCVGQQRRDLDDGNQATLLQRELGVRGQARDWQKLHVRSRQFRYATERDWAWRNALVAAINAGVEQRIFGFRPTENFWHHDGRKCRSGIYYFEIAPGIPGIAWVHDAGFDELNVHVGLWPAEDADRVIAAWNAGFAAADVFAIGWLERRDGPYLMVGGAPLLNCRAARLTLVAQLGLSSQGYADYGNLRM